MITYNYTIRKTVCIILHMITYNYTIIKTVYNFTYLYTRAVVNAWSVQDHS